MSGDASNYTDDKDEDDKKILFASNLSNHPFDPENLINELQVYLRDPTTPLNLLLDVPIEQNLVSPHVWLCLLVCVSSTVTEV